MFKSKWDSKEKRTRGRRWMALRHVVMVEEPVCSICKRRPSVQVDHIVPVSKGGKDDRQNLQGVCLECHELKTRDDLGIKKLMVKIGIDGYPIQC